MQSLGFQPSLLLYLAIWRFALQMNTTPFTGNSPKIRTTRTAEFLQGVYEDCPETVRVAYRSCHGFINLIESIARYYAGRLIIGWIPYQMIQVQAAGFYGVATPNNSTDSFVSVFVFARLDGSLVTLGSAGISSLSGGFRYNSNMNVPTLDQIVNFSFIKQGGRGDGKDTAMQTLQKLTYSREGGQFSYMTGTYWAAVGMKIDAFQLVALDAVAVVQLGDAIKPGIFTITTVDIPNLSSPANFAYVELGIAGVVDLAYGMVKAGRATESEFIRSTSELPPHGGLRPVLLVRGAALGLQQGRRFCVHYKGLSSCLQRP